MPEGSDEYVGARIAELRRQRGLTQNGLAMRAHVSKSLLSKVECGQRPASAAFIAACARGLNVAASELLGQPYSDELRRDRLNVAVHAVAIASDLEDYDQAIRLAEQVRIPGGWTRSRAGHHWVDVAKIHAWAGDRTQALDCLERARRVSPQQTKYHPTTRETVVQLRRRERSPSGSLARFAAWVGVR